MVADGSCNCDGSCLWHKQLTHEVAALESQKPRIPSPTPGTSTINAGRREARFDDSVGVHTAREASQREILSDFLGSQRPSRIVETKPPNKENVGQIT